jgi:hypothetical protein
MLAIIRSSHEAEMEEGPERTRRPLESASGSYDRGVTANSGSGPSRRYPWPVAGGRAEPGVGPGVASVLGGVGLVAGLGDGDVDVAGAVGVVEVRVGDVVDGDSCLERRAGSATGAPRRHL